ncbi:hypothetical protein [Thermococcus sp. JCM 11816]
MFYYYGHTAKILPSTEVNGFMILQNPPTLGIRPRCSGGAG